MFGSFIAGLDTLPTAELVAGVLPRAVAIIRAGIRELDEKCELAGILAATEARGDAA
jgi:hypothetical protein